VGSKFEDHPDFKGAFSFENKQNLLSTVERAIEVLSEGEKLNRIDDVFRALSNAEDKLYECINSIKDQLKPFD
jgi:hypothetical protein